MNTAAQMRQPTIYDTTERVCAKYELRSIDQIESEIEANDRRDTFHCSVAVLAFFAIVIVICGIYIFIRRLL